MNIQSRLKNYGLWVAVAAFALLLAQTLGYLNLPEQVQNFHQLVNGLLGILVLMGIVNDPTTESKGYNDDLVK